jgi:hypothetical protein
MFTHIQKLLSPRGIEAEQVLLRSVQLPQLLNDARLPRTASESPPTQPTSASNV